jgi:Tfp pilus assembly protein PilO
LIESRNAELLDENRKIKEKLQKYKNAYKKKKEQAASLQQLVSQLEVLFLLF